MSVSSPLRLGLTGCPSGEGDPAKDAADTWGSSPEEHFGRGGPSDPQADPRPEGLMGLAAVGLNPV